MVEADAEAPQNTVTGDLMEQFKNSFGVCQSLYEQVGQDENKAMKDHFEKKA